jgi:hypothetical protein
VAEYRQIEDMRERGEKGGRERERKHIYIYIYIYKR